MEDLLKKVEQDRKNNINNSLIEKRNQRNIVSEILLAKQKELQNYNLDLDEINSCISNLDTEETAILSVHKTYEENKISKDDLLKGNRIENEVQNIKNELETKVYNHISDVNFAKEIGKKVKIEIEDKIENCEESISLCNLKINMIDTSIISLTNQLNLL
jgi:hypothetical protein